MKSLKLSIIATLVLFLLTGPALPAEKYANRESSEIIAKMIDAHGGMDAWEKVKTLYVDRWQRRAGQPAGHDWEFNITADLKGWRVYEVWWGKQHVVWDGEKGWTKDFKLPFPAKFVATIGLYMTIKMSFDKGVGITWDDYYLLYIDPDTYLLKGCLINQTYAAILRPGMDAMQQHFVIKNYEEMAGLKMPGEFTTYFANSAKLADGKFYNWQANVEFDESRLKMPEGAVLDTSKPRREGAN
ncbi:MAG: hypothetical protein ACE5IY_13105 [bacterium]